MDAALPSKKRKRAQTELFSDGITRSRSRSPSSSSSIASEDQDLASGSATPLTPVTPRSPTIPKVAKKRPLKYLCDFPSCQKAFARPVRLEEHKRSHTNERIFKCPHLPCDKDFLRESHLKVHIKNAHTDERDYPCDWEGCDKAFSTGTRMRRHRASHEKPKKNEFRCTGFPPCSEVFRRDGNLQKHIDSVHLQLRPLHCPHLDPTTGQPCQSSFDKKVSLRQHEAEYHGETRFTCELCSPDPRSRLTFNTYNELQSHRTQAHPPECEYCGLALSTKAQIRSHIDICHNEAPPDSSKQLPCPHEGCEKTFNKRGNLNVHVKTMHEGQKPFTCGETDISASAGVETWDGQHACGQSFTTKQSLAVHVRRHHMPDSKPKNVRKREKRTKVTTMDKLTGRLRKISCIVTACEQHFDVKADLEDHAAEAHNMDKARVEAALTERAAINGGKFWIGGSDDDEGLVEEDDFTGLNRHATEIGGKLGRALGLRDGVSEPNDSLEEDIKMAGMLSSYTGYAQEEAPDASVIDPALLQAKVKVEPV